jgi:hypothetical protein
VSGNAAGTLYSGPVDLTATAMVKARAVTGIPGSGTEVWSALTSAQFIVGTAASSANLVVSEMCFNPPALENWEFIELTNISAGPIDLTGVQFSAGIAYAFVPGTVLPAGERLVLAADSVAFTSKFPAVTLAGVYTGRLDNSGEEIALTSVSGGDIQRFSYNDKLPWPSTADGTGHSMVLVAPETAPDHANPLNWRASVLPGGSPGGSDALPFAGSPGADSDGDGFSDLYNYTFPGASPLASLAGGQVQLTLRAGADAARVIVESSPDLGTWTSLPVSALQSVSVPSGGTVTETWITPPGMERTFLRARVIPR